MLVLSFKKGQGLGNQLWNYVVLRSVAEHNNYKFKLLNYDLFLAKDFLKLQVSDTKKVFDKKLLNSFKEKSLFDTKLNCFIHLFDEQIFNVNDNTIIEGILQSEEYLRPSIDIINKYIKLKDKNNFLINRENTCILNIRGGEYKRHRELILPKSYWLNAMANMKRFKKKIDFKIVTDDFAYASTLFPSIEIIKGGIKEDFMNLFFCKYAILSNSSFGYFPIKLGTPPDIVIAPNHWARFGNKYERWASPSNIYKDWLWQDKNGEIRKPAEIEKSILDLKRVYASYNVYTTEDFFKKKTLKDFLPKKYRNLLKRLLSKLFPLYVGYLKK